jgi:ABC-type transport system substrate-binding protein
MSDFLWRQRGPLARILAAGVFFSLLLPFMLGGTRRLSAQDPGKKPPVEEEEEDPKAKPPKKKMAEEEEEPNAKQPKKRIPVDEEEDSGPKQKRKVIRVEDEEPTPKPPVKPPVAQPLAGDLRALSKDAKLPAPIRKLYADMVEPHDVLTLNLKKGPRVESIEPLPKYYGTNTKLPRSLAVRPFDMNWKLLKAFHPAQEAVESIIPYEQVAEARIDEFLKIAPAEGMSRRDLLAAARQVLVSVRAFHESARERGRREGEEWDAVEKELKQKLFDVELLQLEERLDADDWDTGYVQAKRLFDLYPARDAQTRIAKALGDYVKRESKGTLTPERIRQLQERLKELEQLNPGGPAAQALGGTLETNAKYLFAEGLKCVKAEKLQDAQVLFKKALELWPQLPGLQDAYLNALNQYPILRVGVRSLPQQMAPGVAWTESERQAVELLFEPLLKAILEPPSEDDPRPGLHYVPCLADGRQKLIRQGALPGRQFSISRNAFWSDGKKLTATDIVQTVRYLKNPRMPGYTPAWAELIDDVTTGFDNTRVSLTLKHGYLDPCSLMTFKVLPKIDFSVYRTEFARKPVGSGPYVYDDVRTIPPFNRQAAVFKSNPYYASRPGKLNLPRIREIQFFQVTRDSVVADFKDRVIDLLMPDAYASMTEPEKLAELSPEVKVIGPLPSRRVYFLAINHRKPMFEGNPELRRALSLVIDRKEILKRCFGDAKGNLPLNGPYPADSWAAKDSEDLYKPALAKSILTDKARDKMKGGGEITIKYPRDDDRARQAVEYICTRIQNELAITIKPEAEDPGELRSIVEDRHTYYLAYYHYDFPTAAYWLWPLFDPRGVGDEPGKGRGNFLGYKNDGQLESLFRQVMTRCEFKDVRRLTHDIHAHLQEKMPLIPLWQLAEHVAIRDGFETGPIDPLNVLGDVEHWRRKTR